MEKFPNIEALLEKLILAMRASDREADRGREDGRTSDFYRGKANAFWACYVQLKQALEADTHCWHGRDGRRHTMTIDRVFCPCLGILVVAILAYFAWCLCRIAAQSDERMEEQKR